MTLRLSPGFPRRHGRRSLLGLAAAAVLLAGCSADEGPTTTTTNTVTIPPGATPTVTISAAPSTVATGGSSTLTWSSTNAGTCTASGAWSGGKTLQGSQTVVASTTPGSYGYTLSCSSADGQQAAATATVTVSPNPAPTVSISAAPATVVAGATTTLSWSSTTATACTASGAWSGSKATRGSETVTTSTVAGSYSYTLLCTASDGQQAVATATVTETAAPTPVADCDQTLQLASITGSKAKVTASTSALCLVCSVSNPNNVIDTDPTTFGTITTTVGLLSATGTISVMDTSTVYPAGTTVGYKIAAPAGALSAGVIANLSLSTSLAGTQQETASVANNTVALSLLNMTISGALPAVVSFVTTKPFDSVALTFGAVLPAAPTLQVYQACATLQ